MASDPDNTSRDLDLVTLQSYLAIEGEMEAEMIHGILEANGIFAIVTGAMPYPPFGFELKVARGDVERARRLIQEAQAPVLEDPEAP